MALGVVAFCLILGACAALDRNAWHSTCGRSKYADAGTSQQIVGGREARRHEFPWQVQMLRYRPASGLYTFTCGGALVHPEWTLTAAHCVNDNPWEDQPDAYPDNPLWTLKLVFCNHVTNDDPSPSSCKRTLNITEIRVFPGYQNVTTRSNDVALVRHDPIQFNENVTALCAPLDQRYPPNEPYDRMTATVSGWGNTQDGGSVSNTLKMANKPVTNNVRCQRAYETVPPPGDRYPAGTISDDMICAGDFNNTNTDSCQGDSGGPLQVQRDGFWESVGIVSWGYKCANPAGGPPGVYARTSNFVAWIKSVVNP